MRGLTGHARADVHVHASLQVGAELLQCMTMLTLTRAAPAYASGLAVRAALPLQALPPCPVPPLRPSVPASPRAANILSSGHSSTSKPFPLLFNNTCPQYPSSAFREGMFWTSVLRSPLLALHRLLALH